MRINEKRSRVVGEGARRQGDLASLTFTLNEFGGHSRIFTRSNFHFKRLILTTVMRRDFRKAQLDSGGPGSIIVIQARDVGGLHKPGSSVDDKNSQIMDILCRQSNRISGWTS